MLASNTHGRMMLQALAEHDLDPLSRGLLAMPHSMCEMRSVALKTVISVTRIVLRPYPKLQGVILIVAFGLLFWYNLRLVCHPLATC